MEKMKFVLLGLPVLLTLRTVYADKQFIIPPFLLGAPESEVIEMKELLRKNADKPDFQMEAVVEQWVKAKGGVIKEKYDQFKANMQLMHEKATLLREAMAKNLSAEARKADEDLANIGNDRTLSAQQKKEKFEKYLANLPLAVRNELQAVFYTKF
ncbi:hypothetical protein LOAG_07252 [Loa loa]|uniref:SXP/RAL-2 family protein Ani s 5-like cation-binding domain-containing protein n=1 Tax=Loa loa TaxID=7209 RepID=A0A1S0TW49_LOALO|nr:hypothetical protein LOAG_07252 [Loa loa]EFO21234.1 hypothetical protein LOAG_07252 [Loa loa]